MICFSSLWSLCLRGEAYHRRRCFPLGQSCQRPYFGPLVEQVLNWSPSWGSATDGALTIVAVLINPMYWLPCRRECLWSTNRIDMALCADEQTSVRDCRRRHADLVHGV